MGRPYADFLPGLFMPARRDQWVNRMLAGLDAFERTLGVSLRLAEAGTKFNSTDREVPEPRKYFTSRLRTKSLQIALTNKSGGYKRTPEGLRNIDNFGLGGRMYFGREAYVVNPTIPVLPADTCEKLLVALGDAFEIESGQFMPPDAAWRLRLAHWCIKIEGRGDRHPLEDRTAAEARLPVIKESTYEGLADLQPHHFGWINYWSREVCEKQGFPARAEGSGLMEHSCQTPRGAWLIKFRATAPPPGDDGFMEHLRDAYERFPGVAIRLPVG